MNQLKSINILRLTTHFDSEDDDRTFTSCRRNVNPIKTTKLKYTDYLIYRKPSLLVLCSNILCSEFTK